MPTFITDRNLEQKILAERQRTGADRYDEVWEGVTMMAPMPNSEHQQIVMRLGAVLQEVIGWPGLGEVFAGVNLSDRQSDWDKNYRVPDLAVFLSGGSAINHGSHWQGGPEFIAEVVSPGDKSRDKTSFYETIGTREVLLVDRHPWQLELYRLDDKRLRLVGTSTTQNETSLESLLGLPFWLVADAPRPIIQVECRRLDKRWQV